MQITLRANITRYSQNRGESGPLSRFFHFLTESRVGSKGISFRALDQKNPFEGAPEWLYRPRCLAPPAPVAVESPVVGAAVMGLCGWCHTSRISGRRPVATRGMPGRGTVPIR